MPKLTRSIPKYRKKCRPGSEPQAVVTLNGRDHYLGLYGSRASKAEYDRLIGEWLASGRSNRFGLPTESLDEPTVTELIAAYRKWALRYYRHEDGTPTGTAENMRPLMKRLRQLYGGKRVSEFTPLAFKAVIRRLIAEKLSISTVNHGIARIKHMFRWGVSEELVPTAVLQGIEAVSSEHQGRSDAKPRKIVHAVPAEVVEQTMPKLPTVVQAMVRLQRLTGMRPAEVCQVRPCDIVESDGVWLFTPRQHKTQHHGKSRVIVIAAKGQEVLKPYMGDPEAFCFSPRKSVELQLAKKSAARVTPLSCGNKPKKNRKIHGGEAYTSCSYRRAIHRACESIWGEDGLKWSPNQLRHALAEEVQGLSDIESVAAVLGHSKIDTSQKYAKHNLRLAIDTMKKIG